MNTHKYSPVLIDLSIIILSVISLSLCFKQVAPIFLIISVYLTVYFIIYYFQKNIRRAIYLTVFFILFLTTTLSSLFLYLNTENYNFETVFFLIIYLLLSVFIIYRGLKEKFVKNIRKLLWIPIIINYILLFPFVFFSAWIFFAYILSLIINEKSIDLSSGYFNLVAISGFPLFVVSFLISVFLNLNYFSLKNNYLRTGLIYLNLSLLAGIVLMTISIMPHPVD
jgi:hypothetical protein